MKKFLLCLFTVQLFSCNNVKTNNSKVNAEVEAPNYDNYKTVYTQHEQDSIDITRHQQDSINIEDALIRLKNLTTASERHDVSSIEGEVDDLAEISEMVNYRELSPAAKLLKEKLIKFQKKEFPILRKNYIQVAAKRLWEEDVKVSGTDDIITFVGGIFAAHANIKKSEEALHDMLIKLRFKRVNFKWIDDDPDYTYYDLNSKKDSE